MVTFFMLAYAALPLLRYHLRLTNQPFARAYRPVLRAFRAITRGHIPALQHHQNNPCNYSYYFIQLFRFFHKRPLIISYFRRKNTTTNPSLQGSMFPRYKYDNI